MTAAVSVHQVSLVLNLSLAFTDSGQGVATGDTTNAQPSNATQFSVGYVRLATGEVGSLGNHATIDVRQVAAPSA